MSTDDTLAGIYAEFAYRDATVQPATPGEQRAREWSPGPDDGYCGNCGRDEDEHDGDEQRCRPDDAQAPAVRGEKVAEVLAVSEAVKRLSVMSEAMRVDGETMRARVLDEVTIAVEQMARDLAASEEQRKAAEALCDETARRCNAALDRLRVAHEETQAAWQRAREEVATLRAQLAAAEEREAQLRRGREEWRVAPGVVVLINPTPTEPIPPLRYSDGCRVVVDYESPVGLRLGHRVEVRALTTPPKSQGGQPATSGEE